MVSLIASFNGISAAVLLLFGISTCIYYLVQYQKTKKKLLPLVAFLMISLGILYLGPTIATLYLVSTGTNIDPYVYACLSYTVTPISISIAMVLGFDIFMNKWRLKILYIFVPLGLVFWILLYAFPNFSIEPGTGELIDISFKNVNLVIAGLYILSCIVVLGGGFFTLAHRIRGKSEYKKAMFLGFGWVCFGISGILDALLSDLLTEIIFAARLIMLAALILIFLGFRPSKA
jgi:hypothetical protein